MNAAQADYRLNYGSPCIDAADTTVAPAQDAAGSPRYNDPRTVVKTGLPNTNGLYADLGAFEFVETAPSDVNLIATTISGPATVTAGDTVAVSWTEANIGSGIVTGPWHDTISLAAVDGGDVIWVGDILVAQGVVLGPGQTYSASASLRVPGGNEGSYRWQVQVNSQGDVFEGLNWTNNTGLAAAPTALTVPTLTLGGMPLTNTFLSSSQPYWFMFVPQTNEDIRLSLALANGSRGALGVYVGEGFMPTAQNYTLAQPQWNSGAVTLSFTAIASLPYYILVNPAWLSNSPASFTTQSSPISAGPASVSPASVGNGPVTLQIQGGQLQAEDAYQLVSPSGSVYDASQVYFQDATVVYATFDLTSAAPGQYTLNLVRSGATFGLLTDPVTVQTAVAPGLEAQAITPLNCRVSRPFTGYITYLNPGNVDIPAPFLILSSLSGATMRLKDSDPFTTGDLPLLGVSSDGPAGILRPGQGWQVPFTAEASSASAVAFSLASVSTDSSAPLDWVTYGAQIRPGEFTDDQWAAILSQLTNNMGVTWGAYVTALDSDVTRLGARGERDASISDLVDFEISKARGLGVSEIAGVVLDSGTGEPLALAQLAVNSTNTASETGFTTTTDAQGRFTVADLLPGTYEFGGIDCDLVAAPTSTVTAETDALHVILRAARTTITGVVASTNVAVAGLTVGALNTDTGRGFTAICDTNGAFRMIKVSPGTYTFQVPGSIVTNASPSSVQITNGQAVTGVSLTIAAGASLSGLVTSAADGTTVSNASLALMSGTNVISAALADASGSYTLKGLTPGTYTLVTMAPGYARTWTNVPVAQGGSNVDIQLGASAAITGAVTIDGQAATNVIVAARLQPAAGFGEFYSQTDTKGTFQVLDLAPGTYNLSFLLLGWGDVRAKNQCYRDLGRNARSRHPGLHPASGAATRSRQPASPGGFFLWHKGVGRFGQCLGGLRLDAPGTSAHSG